MNTKDMLSIRYTDLCKQLGDTEVRITALQRKKNALLTEIGHVTDLATEAKKQADAEAAEKIAEAKKTAGATKSELKPVANGKEETQTTQGN